MGKKATIPSTKEKAYRINNILKLLDICQSTILSEELSINKITSESKRNTDYSTKRPYFKPTYSDKINKQKHQKQRTNRKLEEKIYHKNQKKNLRNDKHHDSKIIYEKITNFSAHNLKF